MRRAKPLSPVEERWLKRNRHQPVNQLCLELARTRYAIKKELSKLEEGNSRKKEGSKQRKKRLSVSRKRPDCDGLFLRSRWEANLYRILRKQPDISLVEYEPYTFSFAPFGILKGTVSYTPDFKVTYKNGSYIWVEVKGLLRRGDGTKVRRFKKYYPKEAEKLKCVVNTPNTSAARFFEKEGIEVLWYYSDLKKRHSKTLSYWE